jgi:hypothetical protein
METFEQYQVAFVSVTQHFNSGTSMGRLVLNVLLSFAQFERELIAERNGARIVCYAARRHDQHRAHGQNQVSHIVQPPCGHWAMLRRDANEAAPQTDEACRRGGDRKGSGRANDEVCRSSLKVTA